MTRPLLTVRGLSMHFGGIHALDRLDMEIQSGEILALIGPNGAGKTTFFNCVTGMYRPTSGTIDLHPPTEQPIRLNGLRPHIVTRYGLARTFQNIRLFPNMTVLENVMIGRHCRSRAKVLGAVFRDHHTREEEKKIVAASLELLNRFGLAEARDEFAKNLPYGDQRRLEIARALATEPLLLLLDEPAAGMNPRETAELDSLIGRIRDQGTTILLIEHDMSLVMRISDRIVVMDYGRKIAQGSPKKIQNDPAVIRAYLGEEIDDA